MEFTAHETAKSIGIDGGFALSPQPLINAVPPSAYPYSPHPIP